MEASMEGSESTTELSPLLALELVSVSAEGFCRRAEDSLVCSEPSEGSSFTSRPELLLTSTARKSVSVRRRPVPATEIEAIISN
jgi:hypothetical protein